MLSFNGKHNKTKVKCLAVMYTVSIQYGINRGISARSLSLVTKLSLGSIKASLLKWHRWGYVKRDNSRDEYIYRISEKGKDYINDYVPRQVIDTALKEMEMT